MSVNWKMYTQFYAMRYAELPVLNMLRPHARYYTCRVSNQVFAIGRYANTNYYHGFMLTENGNFLPSDYCRDLELNVLDEDGNTFIASHDRDVCAFSSSCGWHNGEEFTVYDGALVDIEEIVFDHDGDALHIDDAVWCDIEGEYGADSQTTECYYVEADEVRTVYALTRNTWSFHGDRIHDNSETNDCANCGDSIPAHHRFQDHGAYCSEHCETSDRDNVFRYDYHTDVCKKHGYGLVEHKYKRKPVYTGIELECYVKSDEVESANDFIRNCDYAIPTRDGSLCDEYGVEYVFRPESLKGQMSNVHDFVLNHGKPNLIADAEETETGTYGLHVHVSSHFLSHVDKIKIVTFANKYLAFIEGIGRRKAFGYAKSKYIRKINKEYCQLEYDRYQLVNTTPTHTIEYRFPKSIVNEAHINRNIELCWAMTFFCSHHLSFTDLTSERGLNKFKTYVADNYAMFPNLFTKLYPTEAQFIKDEKAQRIATYKQSKLQEAA